MGVHSHGFVADTTKQAADDLFPYYEHTFNKIGRERGWPRTTRAQFDATRNATGALLVGEATEVADKILYENEVLGGISRIEIQLTAGTVPHHKVMHAIELLGTKVAPAVKKEWRLPRAS